MDTEIAVVFHIPTSRVEEEFSSICKLSHTFYKDIILV